MQKVKQYTGTLAASSTTKSITTSYGMTATMSVNVSRTEFLNNTLVEFLTECGVNVKYENNFLWINGVPFNFYFQGTYVYFGVFAPFNNTQVFVAASSTVTNIFSGNNYNFKISFCGDPDKFVLRITNYSLSYNLTGCALFICKANNIMNGKDSRYYMNLLSSGNMLRCAVQINEDGSIMDIGHNLTTNGLPTTIPQLATNSDDFTNNPGKFPLVSLMIGVFELTDCYMFPAGSGLSGNAFTVENQAVVVIGEEKYFVFNNVLYMLMKAAGE